MANNFDQIRELLRFDTPGDCYWVSLLRRSGDKKTETDPSFRGKAVKRTIASYFVSSIDAFDSLKGDIIKICDVLNCRAYIYLNRRNYEKMTKAMLVNLSEKIVSNTYCSPLKIAASVAGTTTEDKTWLVDVDAEYVPHLAAIKSMIQEITGTTETIIAEIKTKSGLHLITKRFNLKEFSELWNNYCVGKAGNIETPPCKPPVIQKNNPTILYCS